MSAPEEKVGTADFDNFRNSSDRSSSGSSGSGLSEDSFNNLKNNRTSQSKSKSKSPGSEEGGYKKYDKKEDDPFFADFYNRKKNRPKLSERIFNRKPNSSIFDNDSFIHDLRKEFDQGRKMFFDGVDPFGRFPSRGGSPGPAAGGAATTGGSGPGSGSPRMGRTGFPFDSTRSRSRLEDFPMFSAMRRPPAWEAEDPFAGAGSPFHRERNNSGSSGCASGSSTASAGEHEHIIPIRIERSDGSSTTSSPPKTNANSHAQAHAKAHAHQNGHTGQNNPISATPIPMPAPEGMAPIIVEEPQQQPQEPHHHNNTQPQRPQRSSTEVKKSATPASGERSPRAQSAPPDSAGPDKKFVSNINIESTPTSQGPQVTQLGGKNSKEQAQGSGGGRQIPIFVEGQGRPFPNQQRNGPTMPQPNGTEGPPQQKFSRPAERESTPPPKKQTQPKDPLEKVQDISNDVKELEIKIEQFTGTSRKDKEYLFLDEMLTRELIKLDVIETEGREDIRLARKDCIKLIQNCIAKLEAKIPLPGESSEVLVSNNPSGDHPMDVDTKQSDSTSSDNQSNSSNKSNGSNSDKAAIPLGMEGQGQSQSENSMEVVDSGVGESVKVSA